jgi:hypothetical protein
MKKLVLLISALIIITACKKLDKEPIGPTDIRVKNLSDVQMTELTVNTSGGEFNFGTLSSGDTTEYHRFDKAYPKANISAVINGQVYKTDTAIYTWMQYLGQVKATYEIYIKSVANKQLEINNVIMDSSLK